MVGKPKVQHHFDWYKQNSNGKRISCTLFGLDLAGKAFNHGGNYVIWCGADKQTGKSAQTVHVGQGQFRDRFSEHRKDPRIIKYRHRTLYIEWADAPEPTRCSIERFLEQQLGPLEGERHPNLPPIPVNLSWDK